MNAQQNFLDRLHEAHPDTKHTGQATRAQIMSVSTYIPAWLNARKLDRGLYSLPGGKAAKKTATVVEATAPDPVAMKSAHVDLSIVNTAMVPDIDPNYVAYGHYEDLKQIIKSGQFFPVYIVGPTGNGKSTMVEQACARLKKPMIRVNLNSMSDEEQLIGSKTLENGDVKVVEGPVLIAMRTGATLLIDEIDAGSANTLLCLQPILEGKPYYFKLKNERIVPAKGFNIIATANTKGKGSDDGRYIGTNVLNEAFLERFVGTYEQEYPKAKHEHQIIMSLMKMHNCVDEEFADNLVKWAEAIRRTFEDGGVDENITTRRIVHIVNSFAMFGNKKKAIELCCSRFDTMTKSAFIDLFDKISDKVVETTPAPQADPSEDIPF